MRTLLIVDNEAPVCAFLSRFFETRGFRTVTGLDDREAQQRAFRLGAADFVTKPLGLTDQTWARAFFSAD